MDNAPPLNLSTSVKVQESQEIKEGLEGSQQKKDDENYMYFEYGLNNIENVITITGEPVNDNCNDPLTSPSNNCIEHDTDNYNNPIAVHDNILSDQNEIVEEKGESLKKLDSTNSLYHCSFCSKSFLRANQLRQHAKIHIEEKDIYCHICLMKFETTNELMNHKNEHTADDIVVNTNSTAKFIEPEKSNVKIYDVEKKFKCSDCSMSFMREIYLVTHRRKHTGEKPFECDICLTRFKQMSHLTTHHRTHTLDRPYSCNLCRASFSQTGSLRRHLRSHTGERPFKCDECGAVFVEKRNLSRHKLSHSGERPFKCDICTGSFTQLIDLKRHKLSHFGIKPFKCDLCGASFSRKNNLRWHVLTHEGITPYKCETCNVGFRIARDLKTHKRIHLISDAKEYECDKCHFTSPKPILLKQHMVIHNTSQSILCNQCGETFYTQQALLRHIRRHGNAKKFPCDQCPITFSYLKALNKHQTVIHGEKKQTGLNSKQANFKSENSDKSNENLKDSLIEQKNDKNETTTISESNIPKVPDTPDYLPTKEVVDSSPPEEMSSFVINQSASASDDRNMLLPTLVLTQPGLPTKHGRPPGNCPNHNEHVHTMVEGYYDQWQVWCFCDNLNGSTVGINGTQITTTLSSSVTSLVSTSCPTATSCTSLPSTSTQIISNSNSEPLELHQSNYPDNHHYDSNICPYIADQNSIVSNNELTKENLHVENISKSQANTLPIIDNQCDIIRKNNLDGNILMKHVNQNNETNLNDEYTVHDIPVNISDCNATLSELKRAEMSPDSLDQTLSKKDFLFNKKQSTIKYMEPDNNISVIENIPSTVNSAININSEKNVHDIVFQSENETPLPKNNPSNTMDHKIILKTDFSNTYLADELMNKPIHSQFQQSNNNEILGKEGKKTFGCEELQVFENVFQDFASDVANDKDLPLQYCLTVNNPATGEIQIQSDLFTSKETPIVQPIKKRKLVSNSENKANYKVCPYCSKAFMKQSLYDYHIKSHTGENSLICGICKQGFSYKNSLIVHMRNHTGERPYMCMMCDAKFTQKSNLRVHNRTHTGERPFSCDMCEASFSQGSHLKAHKRIHFNLRPFVCKTCNHAFTQKSALTRHEGKHPNRKSLKCNTCQATFTSRDLLKKHTAIHKEKNGSKEIFSKYKLKKIIENNGLQCEENDGLQCEENDGLQSEESNKSITNSEIYQSFLSKDTKELNTIEVESDSSYSKLKHRPAILQPTRRSRRILESNSKKSFKKESDFITGDLDEIDRAEELEDQLIPLKPRNYRKKSNNAEVVQSWCFCEIPHGPNEPHTHIQSQPVVEHIQEKQDNHVNDVENQINPTSDTVYQLSIPNLSHSMVLHGNESNENSLPINNREIIIRSSENTHTEIPMGISTTTSHFEESELPSINVSSEQRLVSENIRGGENGNIFESSPTVSQVFTTNQLVTPEGNTLYTLDPEVLNAETVVLNSSAGTIFFDVSSDGQMMAIPIQEPIVVGSANDIQNTINLSGTASCLSSISPVSINLPIDNLQEQNVNEPMVSQNETKTNLFTNSSIATPVNFDPLQGNIVEMFSSMNENIILNTSAEKKQPIVMLPFKCILCSKEFVRKTSLYQHMKEMHADSQYCEQCFAVFPTNSELLTHKLEHSPENVCDECNGVFTSRAQLNRHRAAVHNVSKIKKEVVNCAPCGAKFTQISDYKRHLQSHLGVKPFVCKVCGAPFTRKYSLNKHERIHTGEKPYSCSECNKSFSYRYQFNRHAASPCTS